MSTPVHSFRLYLLVLLLSLASTSALAESYISVCYNWGCSTRQGVGVSEAWISKAMIVLRQAKSAEQERFAAAEVVRQFYVTAAEQTPIGADQPGNFNDQDVVGRMDCIDHSTTTRNILSYLQHKQALRWHRVGPYAHRSFLMISHYSATLIELGGEANEDDAQVYTVDPWMVESGTLPQVANLREWAGYRFYSLETQHPKTVALPLAAR